MKWWDRLMGRAAGFEDAEREEDQRALDELRRAGRRVGNRTDRLIEAYEQTEKLRLRRKR